MNALASYPTAGGARVVVDTRTNAFNQTVHAFECTGCNGIRGFDAPEIAHGEAAKHAGRCTHQPGGGAS